MKKSMRWILSTAFVVTSIGNAVYHIRLQKPVKEQRQGSRPCILCIGDSITFGDGVRAKRQNCWARLLEKISDGEFQVLNYGINGATLQAEGDKPYDPSFWETAKSQRPETVILMLGTNDSKPQNWNRERYEKELTEKLREIQGWEGVEKLIVMLPPWCCGIRPGKPVLYRIQNNVIRNDICPIIRKVAAEQNAQVIDLYELTENHPEYFTDGIHPNVLGNQVIAELIKTQI